MEEKKLLKELQNNAKFIEGQARYLKSYYFHRRNKWLSYIPFYQIAYLWKIRLWGLKTREIIQTALNMDKLMNKAIANLKNSSEANASSLSKDKDIIHAKSSLRQ